MTLAFFWICAALLGYALVGFPALAWLRARLLPRALASADIEPRISVIVCAHNEAQSIAAKLENLLALEYPGSKLQLLIASDGSSDATNAVVRRFFAAHADAAWDARLLELPRGGKIATLNAAVAQADGDVVVFSDANSQLVPGALRALMRPLADPGVGGVAGDQRYAGDSGAEGERTYWDFDRALKRWQSAAGSVTSATGALYAVRRSLVPVVPPAVTDDFWISTQVIAAGQRLVFAPDAIAVEPPAARVEDEFQRKVRVMTRGLRAVGLRGALLDPRRTGFYSVQILSHKLLRRLTVLPLLGVLALTPWLWGYGLAFRVFVIAELAFYAAAALAALGLGRSRVFRLPQFFCMACVASLVAAWNALRGHRIDRWEPDRAASAGATGEPPDSLDAPLASAVRALPEPLLRRRP